MRGGDQVPFRINRFQAPQQKATLAPDLLDLSVHRFHNGLALGVDRCSGLASQFGAIRAFAPAFLGIGPR